MPRIETVVPVRAPRPSLAEEFGREAQPGHHFVRSLMSQKVIEIRDDTPLCCDPSTETYWSM